MTTEADKSLRWSRRLSFVPRWSVAPMLRRQSVAEHCFHVARITIWLIEIGELQHSFKDVAMLGAISLALEHDDDEAAFGDAPAPSKVRKKPHNMEPIEVVVKCADILETIAFVYEEMALGNKHGMQLIYHDVTERLKHYWLHCPWYNGDRPSTEDLITKFLAQIVSQGHPVLEARDA